jgi:preprotein translocase subunit YajC
VITLVAEPTGGGSGLSGLLFPLVLVVGMYLLLIRPQRARAKQNAAVRSRLEPGSQVVTTAGLHAEVVSVDGLTTVLEIAPGVRCTFLTQAVVQVLEEPADEEPADAAPDENPTT